MSNFAEYLRLLDLTDADPHQSEWYEELAKGVSAGRAIASESNSELRTMYAGLLRDWIRTEELKAWYGEREGESVFQGTSVTAITVPAKYSAPLELGRGIESLEDSIAREYIAAHDRIEPNVRAAILEDVSRWMHEGVFYGIVLASKVVAQALNLSVRQEDVVFKIDRQAIDPHEITSFPDDIRREYFERCLERLDCFDGVDLDRREFESALVVADISKPHIETYRNRLLLGPVRCNEIAALLARRLVVKIRDLSGGRISPRSLSVTIFDTDTPYTYHQVNGYFANELSPVLPGVTVLGTSGTIDAFRWLYAYRVSLSAQKLMKSSLYSEVAREFVPFVFCGVLVERDAEILLDLDRLSVLRYRGQISPYLEYMYMLPKLRRFVEATTKRDLDLEVEALLR